MLHSDFRSEPARARAREQQVRVCRNMLPMRELAIACHGRVNTLNLENADGYEQESRCRREGP